MKKRNLIKLFGLTLCFITIFSTVALAKSNENTKFDIVSACKADPFPGTGEFPE